MGKKTIIAETLDRFGLWSRVLDLRKHLHDPFLSILTYHRIGHPSDSPLCDADIFDSTPERFRQELAFLKSHFQVLSLAELRSHLLQTGRLPRRAALITFDDGYKDNLTVAAPLLREFGLPASFFIATDFIAERRMFWWDAVSFILGQCKKPIIDLAPFGPLPLQSAREQILLQIKAAHGLDIEGLLQGLAKAAEVDFSREIETAEADRIIMTWDEIRTLSKMGMEIQSHTRGHRVLQTVPTDELDNELQGSKSILEGITGEEVFALAFPVGRTLSGFPHVRTAIQRAGYDLAFSNCSGVNRQNTFDRFEIRRMGLEFGMPHAMFRAMLAVPQLGYSDY